MQKPYKSIQIFKSPFLEKLTHVHPLTPLVVWVPIIGWFLWQAAVIHELSVSAIVVLGMLGFFVWTLTEYILHRFVFHFVGDSKWTQRLHFLIHGIHHDDPNDPTRLVMPPVASIVLSIPIYGLFRLFLGPIWIDPFFAFFLVGYLTYDYIHYFVHHFRPKTAFGKMLKQHHMQHHFVTQNARWGVSSPLWDIIFGSLEDVKEKKRAV